MWIACDLYNAVTDDKMKTIHVMSVPLVGHTITIRNDGSVTSHRYRVTAVEHVVGTDLGGNSHHTIKLRVGS